MRNGFSQISRTTCSILLCALAGAARSYEGLRLDDRSPRYQAAAGESLDGTGGTWTYCADLSDWQSVYGLWGERHFVGRLARNLAGRGLAENRRAALALTTAGIDLDVQREREAAAATAEIDWSAVAW